MTGTRDLIGLLLRVGCVVWALTPVRAQAESLRTLVRLADEPDQALAERVRGQTSDLETELVLRTTGPLEPTLVAQLAAARALGSTAGAQLVVWFARTPPRLEVRVADLRAERVLVREIGRGEGELSASAQDEAAALVVRSAVRASLLGAALGSPEQELVDAPLPLPAPPSAAPVLVPPAARSPAVPMRWRIAVGSDAGLDGAGGRGHVGFGLRLGVALRAFELGLRGGFGLASQVQNEVADVDLSQHRAGLYAAFAPMLRDWLQLVAEGGVDLQVFTTRVRAELPRFDGRPLRALLPSLRLGVGARLWFRPQFALALSVGAQALPTRPVLGYDAPGGFVAVRRPWPLQPLLTLELVARF